MRNIFELSKQDLWWLEDKFQRYKQMDKEIAIRKEELKIKQVDENTGGGKTNQTSRPVETEVLKSMNDPYIKTRELWKTSIEKVYKESSEEVQKIVCEKYWSDKSYMSWSQIAKENYISKSQVYRLRYDILERFAKEIGYV